MKHETLMLTLGSLAACGFAWTWHPPITVMPGVDGHHSDRLCIRLSGPKGTAVTGLPARGVPLRPNTRYRVSGNVRTDGDAEVWLEALRGRVGDLLPVTKKPPEGGWAPEWHRFERQFTSGPNDWWLQGSIIFRLGGEGTAWLMVLHNALWAPALSGLSSAVCSWWWGDRDKADAYRHYRPLASFVADIPPNLWRTSSDRQTQVTRKGHETDERLYHQMGSPWRGEYHSRCTSFESQGSREWESRFDSVAVSRREDHRFATIGRLR